MIEEKVGSRLPEHYYLRKGRFARVERHDPAAMAPGFTLVTGIGANNEISAQVVDSYGRTIHSWTIDWFRIWPHPTHLDRHTKPKRKPGANLHGVVMADNGDLIFNFERLGMVRLDLCSNVKWRLARRTHHSLYWDADSRTFWTGVVIPYRGRRPPYPNHDGPFSGYSVLEISEDGKVLREIPIIELLESNGLQGLLYLSNIDNTETNVSGDTLHVNDVEPFPADLPGGTFVRGDIMVSLRNINAIIVFEKETLKIKFMTIGKVLRQHDPDFIDGNTISVLDNNNLQPRVKNLSSKIVRIDAVSGDARTVFQGTPNTPFFTDIMGKHQTLPNGNILITEGRSGRALEITASGRPVWEYFNLVKPELLALMDEAQRLPPRFDATFFAAGRDRCK